MVEYKMVEQEGEIAVRKVRITAMRKACYRDLMGEVRESHRTRLRC